MRLATEAVVERYAAFLSALELAVGGSVLHASHPMLRVHFSAKLLTTLKALLGWTFFLSLVLAFVFRDDKSLWFVVPFVLLGVTLTLFIGILAARTEQSHCSFCDRPRG